MLESCVAPIFVLIISMFYRKVEQVCATYVEASSAPEAHLRLEGYRGFTQWYLRTVSARVPWLVLLVQL